MKRLARKYGSEYAILHREGGEKRVKKLLKIAKIASDPKLSDKPEIYKTLESNDPAERYWAVTALGQLTPEKDVQKLQKALTDNEPSVRIAAIRSLYWAGHKKQAVGFLEKELKNTGHLDEVLHFALHVLSRVGDDAKGLIDTVKQLRAAGKKSEYVNRLAKRLINKFESE